MSSLHLTDVHKAFGTSVVVDGLDLEVASGRILALLGPSGCGKTTTLRMVAGFEQPDRGTIAIDGEVVAGPNVFRAPERRGVGMVFQDLALFPHLSVRANVAFGLRSLSRKERIRRVDEWLERVGLTKHARRRPGALSGGEAQRVALARALAPGPKVILLDEPFNSLDANLRDGVRNQVRGVLAATDVTTILVTHDRDEALSFAHDIAVMHGGDIEQVGERRELLTNPRTGFVARFLCGMNVFPGVAEGRKAITSLGAIDWHGEATGAISLGLRPDQIEVHADGVATTVVHVHPQGRVLLVRVLVDGIRFDLEADVDAPVTPGETLHVRANAPAIGFGV